MENNMYIPEVGDYVVYGSPYGKLTHVSPDSHYLARTRRNNAVKVMLSKEPATCQHDCCIGHQKRIYQIICK